MTMYINRIKSIPKKLNIPRLIILSCCLIPAFILFAIAGKLANSLDAQTVARRFDKSGKYAHVSAFLSDEAAINTDSIPMVRYFLSKALEEGSVEESENGGRSYLIGYSTPIGTITVSSPRANVSVETTAVGGDFFMFHPYELLSGSYFDSNDLNEDGVMLDADAAWTLFGGSNVAGMQVEINGKAYPVRGVIKRDSGMFAKASGEESSMIFVSFDVADGQPSGDYFSSKTAITCFELLMKNPVKHFAYDTMENTLKDSMFLTEGTYELVENSSRYSLLSELKVIGNLGSRSMKTNLIPYPGWENRARGYEDVIGVLTLLGVILMVYPVIISVIYAVKLIKYLIEKIKKLGASIRKKAADRYQKKWLERQETNG